MRSYALAVLVVHGLSCFSLAAQAYARWFSGTRIGFPAVYAVVLLLVAGGGIATLGTGAFEPSSWQLAAAGLMIGAVAGLAASWCDRAVLAAVRRRRKRPVARPRSAPPILWRSAGGRRKAGFRVVQQRQRRAMARWEWTAPTVSVVAVLEEAVHRGVLLGVAGALTSGLGFVAATAGLTLAFACTHVWFGLEHVLAKLPLGALAVALTLGFGTVLPAMAAHVLFNVLKLRELKRSAAWAAWSAPPRGRGARGQPERALRA